VHINSYVCMLLVKGNLHTSHLHKQKENVLAPGMVVKIARVCDGGLHTTNRTHPHTRGSTTHTVSDRVKPTVAPAGEEKKTGTSSLKWLHDQGDYQGFRSKCWGCTGCCCGRWKPNPRYSPAHPQLDPLPRYKKVGKGEQEVGFLLNSSGLGEQRCLLLLLLLLSEHYVPLPSRVLEPSFSFNLLNNNMDSCRIFPKRK
jgi:hypothetical protein